MDNSKIIDVIEEVELASVIINKSIDDEVREYAARLLNEGYETATLTAVEKNGEVSLKMVPSKKAVGFPFSFTPSPVPADIEDDSSTDVQVTLDPATVAAILSAMQEDTEDDSDDYSSMEDSSEYDDSSSSSSDYSDSSDSSSSSDSSDSSDSSSSDDSEMLGSDWKDGLDPWQVELAEDLDETVQNLGRFPTTDVSYVSISPFRERGLTCSNCVAGTLNGCQWVAVQCDADGWCRLNMVGVLEEAEATSEVEYNKFFGFGRHSDEEDEDIFGSPEDQEEEDMEDDEDESEDTPRRSYRKNNPDVSSVHIDAPSNGGGVGSFVGSFRRKPKFVPENMTVIEEVNPEVMQDANLLQKSESIPNQIRKSDEQRYTMGPWYVPYRSDAHGEWTDPQELQEALWGYVRNGDRQIRLQHNVDIVAGEWLEALTWPHEVTVPMLQADSGEIKQVSFPAGTVFLGVQWEPWAWELVKEGKLRGYSIGGTGSGVEADLPVEESPYKTFLGDN